MPIYQPLLQILGRLDLDSMSVQMVLMACTPQQVPNHEGMVSMLREVLYLQAIDASEVFLRVHGLRRYTAVGVLRTACRECGGCCAGRW